jgi:tetratricopeptide (TPR) repeat protein
MTVEQKRRVQREPSVLQCAQGLQRAICAQDWYREIEWRHRLAHLYVAAGDYEAAIGEYRAMMDDRQTRDRNYCAGLAQNGIAAVLVMQHEYTEACETARWALRTNRRIGERDLEADSWSILGDALFGMGVMSRARHAYARALRMHREIGNVREEGWIQVRRARLERRAGERRAARRAARAALAIGREEQDAKLTALAQRALRPRGHAMPDDLRKSA